jgi:hypothetical protein
MVGLTLDGLRKTTAAEDLLRRAGAGMEALVRRYARVDRYKCALIRVRTDLGELLWASGRQTEAAEVFGSARDLVGTFDLDNGLAPTEAAWFLASNPDPQFRDIPTAIAIATRNATRFPDARNSWHVLGVARYRAGNYGGAIEALERLLQRPVSFVGEGEHFLAMAHWQLGHQDASRAHYARGAGWLDQHILQISQVVRHRREAEAPLGIDSPMQGAR